MIIRRHYLDGLTFEDIGSKMGLSKGRVSQIHKAALILLRKRLSKSGDFRLQR